MGRHSGGVRYLGGRGGWCSTEVMYKGSERGIEETVRGSFFLFSDVNGMLLSISVTEDGDDSALHVLLQDGVSA